jgi:hypothetical protein
MLNRTINYLNLLREFGHEKIILIIQPDGGLRNVTYLFVANTRIRANIICYRLKANGSFYWSNALKFKSRGIYGLRRENTTHLFWLVTGRYFYKGRAQPRTLAPRFHKTLLSNCFFSFFLFYNRITRYALLYIQPRRDAHTEEWI